jgi:signal peptidase I
MTLKRAYQTLVIAALLMMLSIILYALDVTKLDLPWGISGFVIATVFSIFSISFSIHHTKHRKDVEYKNFFLKYRFDILDWFTFLGISLMTIFLVFTFFILPSDVSQSSMSPTLENHNRILVSHFNYEPKLNDITIIEITKDDFPNIDIINFYKKKTECPFLYNLRNLSCQTSFVLDENNQFIILDSIYFVKRIVAVSGDKIEFISITPTFNDDREYKIRINGNDYYNQYGQLYKIFETHKNTIEASMVNGIVPNDLYFVLGDNERNSVDSRSFGLVSKDSLIGKVVFKLMPLGGVK